MIKNVSKTAIMLSVCLIQTFSMFADDKEMPDNYKPINISVETVTGEKLGEGFLEVFVDL